MLRAITALELSMQLVGTRVRAMIPGQTLVESKEAASIDMLVADDGAKQGPGWDENRLQLPQQDISRRL